MNILVIGGVHGDEPLGTALVALLKANPLPGIDCLVANVQAVANNVRYIETDLNRSFMAESMATHEGKLATKLRRLSRRYDVVLDFHNTQASANDCGFIGEGSRPELLDVASQLKLTRCVVATYDCINKACPNALSIEISLGSSLNSALYWYGQLELLVHGVLAPARPPEIYRYLSRVTWQQKQQYKLQRWRAFKPLTDKEKQAFGLNGTIVPIFVGSKFTEYYATLLRREQ